MWQPTQADQSAGFPSTASSDYRSLAGRGRGRGSTEHKNVEPARASLERLGLCGIAGPVTFTSAAAARRNSTLLLHLGLIAMLIAVAAFLRSSSRSSASSEEDRTVVRELLDQGGGDSLGYFATRDDRAFVFSPSRKAAVAYTVVSGVCLAAWHDGRERGFRMAISRSLYRANAKFRPSWEPRFICSGSSRDLATVAYAALRAEGFLTLAHRNPFAPRKPGTADDGGGRR
jgi:hypothetical protein